MSTNRKMLKLAAQGLLLVSVIALALYLTHFARTSEEVKMAISLYGYWGIFLVSFVSGFNLAIPIPAVAFLPLFLESGLPFWSSIVFVVLGTTAADLIAYALGKFGRRVTVHTVNHGLLNRLERVREKYRWAPLVILFIFVSLVPFPNEVLLVPLGFLGYRLIKIMPVVIAGNFIFNTLYATGVIGVFQAL